MTACVSTIGLFKMTKRSKYFENFVSFRFDWREQSINFVLFRAEIRKWPFRFGHNKNITFRPVSFRIEYKFRFVSVFPNENGVF